MRKLVARHTGLEPCDALGWKHGFPQATAVPEDVLVVGVVRNAVAWALSMHAKPWHTTAEMQGLVFPDFIRAPWETVFDRPRYFSGLPGVGPTGTPLIFDRHPDTGELLPNLFALRRLKLDGMLRTLESDCSSILLRLEALQKDPETVVQSIRQALNLEPAPGFRPVRKRLGTRFKPAEGISRPATPQAMSDEDVFFLTEQLDLGLESRLGYDYATGFGLKWRG